MKWNLKKLQSDVAGAGFAGCWKTLAGYTLLKPDGEARIKITGRGASCDLDGKWHWDKTGEGGFRLFPTDLERVPGAVASEFTVSRFDDTILELRSTSTAEGIGTLENVVLWKKSKPPKNWQEG